MQEASQCEAQTTAREVELGLNKYCETKRGVLYQGDCLEVMKTLPDKSVDLIVTSPPYDNLRNYEGSLTDWNFEKFKAIAQELFRITKEGGVVVWVVNDATIKGSETGTSFRQALYFKDIGFNLHDTMIWEKQTFTAVDINRYRNVFEYMFVFSKGAPKTFNCLNDRKIKYVGWKKHGTIRRKDGSMKSKSSLGKVYDNEFGARFNVWRLNTCVSNTERTGHPAQFPLNLAQDHITSWSNEGDVVLDCFMGSGTTAEACENLNRKWIGIEREEKYCEITKNRLKNFQEVVLSFTDD